MNDCVQQDEVVKANHAICMYMHMDGTDKFRVVKSCVKIVIQAELLVKHQTIKIM